MKKRLTMLSCVLAGSILVGCGGGTTPEIIMPDEPMTSSVGVKETVNTNTSSAASENETIQVQDSVDAGTPGENYIVYLITMDLTDSYWQSIDEGCRKAVDELGNIAYQWIGPDAHDDALQSACIDEAVASGANAILIAANSANGVNESLQKAEETGCKIVYVDSAASYECVTTLATDNEAAGGTAAETMKAALAAQGIESGTIGIMGVTEDTVSCVARENGFRAAFEGTDYVLADTVYMQDDAGNITNAVNEGIANGYVGFFGTNEGTTVTIGEAKRDAEANSVVVGFDTSDAVLSLVSEDYIYATMQQNPQTMGYEGLKIAVGALEGSYTDTNTKTDTGVTVITKESM